MSMTVFDFTGDCEVCGAKDGWQCEPDCVMYPNIKKGDSAVGNQPNELPAQPQVDEILVSMVNNWTRYAGVIYSYVCLNEERFKEFQKTVPWQLIKSTAKGQEQLHEITQRETNARNDNYTN